MRERRRILWLVGLLIAAISAYVLSAVITTIVLAIATSYVLLPVHKWILRRGLTPYWSAIASTLVGVVVALVVASPFGYILYVRRKIIISTLRQIDGKVTIATVGDQPIIFDVVTIREAVVPGLSEVAVAIAQSLSSLAAKFVVFAFIVFALLYYHRSLRNLAFGPVPSAYHGIVERVHTRIREVLMGHYVLVLIGGAVTFCLGVVVFVTLNYELPYFLALVGAILWILPFISAAPLVLALTFTHALNGEPVFALTVGVMGAVFLVAIPNTVVILVRKRFGNPDRLDQTLYFVGFVGGGLTVGLVGLVLGPIVLAILISLLTALADREASEFT